MSRSENRSSMGAFKQASRSNWLALVSRGAERSQTWAGTFWSINVIAISVVLCLPFIRYLHWLGDEGVLLHAGQRILSGEVLYRDFFEIMPPGGFAIVSLWMA